MTGSTYSYEIVEQRDRTFDVYEVGPQSRTLITSAYRTLVSAVVYCQQYESSSYWVVWYKEEKSAEDEAFRQAADDRRIAATRERVRELWNDGVAFGRSHPLTPPN